MISFSSFFAIFASKFIYMQEIKKISDYRLSLKDRIVEESILAFASRGIKAVKMDDIARSLGISKRTLYELYSNKEELLIEVLTRSKAQKLEEEQHMYDQSHNVMDMVLTLYYMRMEELNKVNPLFFSDLVKYPRLMRLLNEDREERHMRFMEFLNRGIREGYFRSDVNYAVVTRILEGMSDYVITQRLYQQFSFDEIFYNVLFVMLRGFCTQKGIDVLEDFFKKKKGIGKTDI